MQVGIIQYHNFTCADSGAGVRMLPVGSSCVTIEQQLPIFVNCNSLVQHMQESCSLCVYVHLLCVCERYNLRRAALIAGIANVLLVNG